MEDTSREYFMNCYVRHNDGTFLSEHKAAITVDGYGVPTQVMTLSDQEAKALISEEYGFEYGSIKIEAVCWYDATDWNYFRFSVKGWQYEAKNYNAPTII